MTAAKDQETTHKQDAFAAQTCLAWIHWELAEPDQVLSVFPGSIAEAEEKLRHGDESFTGWTQVCIVKAAYLKGVAQEKTGSVAEAIQTYQSVLHFVGSDILSSASLQFKVYSEALLARLCLLLDLNHVSDRPENPNAALHAFRLWSRLMEGGKAQFSGEAMTDPPDMRRAVWKAYYDTLSIILRRGLLYSGSSDPDQALLGDAAEHASQEQYTAARLQQRVELKLVETVYEALLLRETRFPKASGTNEEVDEWTESVMSSWRIICGPAWTDDELGEGGKSGVGKGVLDVCGVVGMHGSTRLIVSSRFSTAPRLSHTNRHAYCGTCSLCTLHLQSSNSLSRLSTLTWRLSAEAKTARRRAEKKTLAWMTTTRSFAPHLKRSGSCVVLACAKMLKRRRKWVSKSKGG